MSCPSNTSSMRQKCSGIPLSLAFHVLIATSAPPTLDSLNVATLGEKSHVFLSSCKQYNIDAVHFLFYPGLFGWYKRYNVNAVPSPQLLVWCALYHHIYFINKLIGINQWVTFWGIVFHSCNRVSCVEETILRCWHSVKPPTNLKVEFYF